MAHIRPDLLWKGIIESLIEDFLLLFFPSLAPSIDFGRGFEFLDNELAQLAPDAADTRRLTDKLIKVFLKDGSERWVLIHVEVQGYQDRDFPKRLFIYYYRLLDRYGLPVTTLAILIDKNSKYKPTKYETNFTGTRLLFEFNTYKLLDHPLEELEQLVNPFARVLEVSRIALDQKKLNEEHLFQLKLSIVRRMTVEGYKSAKIRQLMNFIRTYIRFANEEIIRRFEKEVDHIFKKSKAMGLEEIILEETKKEGKREEKIKVVYNCWKEGSSVEFTAKITELPLEEVQALFDRFSSTEENE